MAPNDGNAIGLADTGDQPAISPQKQQSAPAEDGPGMALNDRTVQPDDGAARAKAANAAAQRKPAAPKDDVLALVESKAGMEAAASNKAEKTPFHETLTDRLRIAFPDPRIRVTAGSKDGKLQIIHVPISKDKPQTKAVLDDFGIPQNAVASLKSADGKPIELARILDTVKSGKIALVSSPLKGARWKVSMEVLEKTVDASLRGLSADAVIEAIRVSIAKKAIVSKAGDKSEAESELKNIGPVALMKQFNEVADEEAKKKLAIFAHARVEFLPKADPKEPVDVIISHVNAKSRGEFFAQGDKDKVGSETHETAIYASARQLEQFMKNVDLEPDLSAADWSAVVDGLPKLTEDALQHKDPNDITGGGKGPSWAERIAGMFKPKQSADKSKTTDKTDNSPARG